MTTKTLNKFFDGKDKGKGTSDEVIKETEAAVEKVIVAADPLVEEVEEVEVETPA
jgi:hypothetical protein